jgi:transketolase
MGLSYANGIAIASKLDGLTFNIFLIVGDGELQEGQVWEAAMNTSCRRLNNVCVLVDRNRFQSQGNVEEIKSVEPLLDKWVAFGWDAVRIDGHDMQQICSALDRIDGSQDKPLAIIADTMKGKGVGFMEDTYKYHNSSINEDEYRRAVAELEERIASFAGSRRL